MSNRAVLLRTLEKHPQRLRVIGTKSPHRLSNVQLVAALRQLDLSPDVIIAIHGMFTRGEMIANRGGRQTLLAKVALNAMSAMTAEVSPGDFAKFLRDRLTPVERRALGPYLVQVALAL
jgi:hypothetical protein